MNLISSKSIIAKLYRDLRIDDDSISDSFMEWIAEGLDYIGAYLTRVQKDVIVPVSDFKFRLPSDFFELTDIFYNPKATPESEPITYTIRLKNNGPNQNLINHLRKTVYYQDVPGYKIEYPFVHVDFETGYVLLLYKGLPIDFQNNLMIPDSSDVKEALKWNIIRHMMESGWQHPAGFKYDFVDAQWQRYCGQARSAVKMPNVHDYERIADTWGSFYKQVNQTHIVNDLVQYTKDVLEQ